MAERGTRADVGCHRRVAGHVATMTRYMVHGTWYMVHGTWYMVHGTWYMVHDTCQVGGDVGMCSVTTRVTVVRLIPIECFYLWLLMENYEIAIVTKMMSMMMTTMIVVLMIFITQRPLAIYVDNDDCDDDDDNDSNDAMPNKKLYT